MTGTLASRVAEQLLDKIAPIIWWRVRACRPRQAMARHFGVSRTVIREAIARLKVDGPFENPQGSGAFVRDPGRIASRTERPIH